MEIFYILTYKILILFFFFSKIEGKPYINKSFYLIHGYGLFFAIYIYYCWKIQEAYKNQQCKKVINRRIFYVYTYHHMILVCLDDIYIQTLDHVYFFEPQIYLINFLLFSFLAKVKFHQ